MKFRLEETYTDYGYMNNNTEVASDNSDEFPEEKKKEKVFFVPYMSELKKYEVTIKDKPSKELWARSPKDASRICRLMYDKEKIKILGVEEI